MRCEWPVDTTCLPELPTLPDSPSEAQQAEYDQAAARRASAIDTAIQILWALSGRQYGVCPYTARPCPPLDLRMPRWSGPVLIWDGDNWMNAGCGCVGGGCTISGPGAVHLPGPVQSVTSVEIEGVALDPEAYTVEGNTLYRTDGRNWPSQDLSRPAGAPGTWVVRYTAGVPVPEGVGVYVGALAAEIIKACGDGGKCRIPRNVVAVTRQGVSYQVYDPQTIYDAGKTGLPEVDLWLSAVNPHHLLSAPSVR